MQKKPIKQPLTTDKLEKAFDSNRITSDAVRPTILKLGSWRRTSQDGLLSKPVAHSLSAEDTVSEHQKTLGFLDCLTRSGEIAVDNGSLHIFIASTHCFDKTLVNSIVQENKNPIEDVEAASLIMNTLVHNVPHQQILRMS